MSLLIAEHQAGKLSISILMGVWFDPIELNFYFSRNKHIQKTRKNVAISNRFRNCTLRG